MEFLSLWRIFLKRFWLIFLSAISFFLLVMVFTFVVTPTYKAKAKLLVDMSGAHASLMNAIGMRDSTSVADNSEHNTDIALATLRPILEETIAIYNLKNRSGETLKPDKFIKWTIVNKFRPQPYLSVDVVEDTDLLAITAESPDAQQAADIANKVATLYINTTTQRIKDEYKIVAAYLDDQIKTVEKQYYDSLARLEEFKVAKNTVDLSLETQRLSSLEDSLLQLHSQLAGRAIDISKEHPDFKILEKQIEIFGRQVAELRTGMANRQSESSRLSMIVTVKGDVYQKLLEYQTQLGLMEALTLSNTRLAETAAVPYEKNFPKKLLMALLGFFFGSFFGLSVGFFVEYVDSAAKASPAKPEKAS